MEVSRQRRTFIYTPVALIRLNYLIDTVDDKDSPFQFTQSKSINVVFDRSWPTIFCFLLFTRKITKRLLGQIANFFMVHSRRHRQKMFCILQKYFKKLFARSIGKIFSFTLI